MDGLDKLDDVVGTVNEEASYDTVMTGDIRVEYTSKKSPAAMLNLKKGCLS